MKNQKWLIVLLGVFITTASIFFTAYLKKRRRDRNQNLISEVIYKEREINWVKNSFYGLSFETPNTTINSNEEISDLIFPGVKTAKVNFLETGDLTYYVLFMDMDSEKYEIENGMRGILSNLVKERNGVNLEYQFRINDRWPFATAEGSFDHDSETFIIQAFLSFNAIKGHNNLRSLVILGNQNDQNNEIISQSMGSLELDSLKSEKNFLAWSYSKGQKPEKLSDQEDSVTIAKRKAGVKKLSEWYEKYKAENSDHQEELKSDGDTPITIKDEFSDPSFYNERGNSKADFGDFKGSMADYTKAIKLNSSFSEAYYNRGISKMELRDHEGAITDFSKVIEFDPKDADAYFNRGSSKSELQNYRGAIADFTKVIELNSGYIGAFYNRGLSRGKIDDYAGSIADFNKAIELDPTESGSYFNRGISKLKSGQTSSGCLDLANAEKLGYPGANEIIRNYCK